MIKKRLIYLSILLLLFGCNRGDELQPVLELPTITTLNATNVSGTAAISGGNIVSNGGDSITVYGLCWSATPNPTTADFHSAVTGTASTFTYTLTALKRSTTYYVRAYAINSVGTGYGNQVNFTTNATAHFYIVGKSAGRCVYWIDGIPTPFTNSGTLNDAEAYSIVVANNDVYVAGYELNLVTRTNEAKVWKNTVGTTLSDPGLHGFGQAVSVVNNDVYVVGSQNFLYNNYVAKVWKNGVATTLSTPGADANPKTIFAVNNDIYIGGYEETGVNRMAMVWKNNIPTNLVGFCFPSSSCTYDYSDVRDIFIAGNDVYAVGTSVTGITGQLDSIFWKNGIPTRINIFPHSIFVNNNDIYIAGRYGKAAGIWKNGIVTKLSEGIDEAYASSVFVLDNDVYVVGSEKRPGTSVNRIAKYWKNGVVTNLTDGLGIGKAYDIVVQ